MSTMTLHSCSIRAVLMHILLITDSTNFMGKYNDISNIKNVIHG